MLKISLIRPLYQTGVYDPEIQEPLGILTLAGYLRQAGRQVQVLDCMLSGESEIHTARRCAAFHPSLVGFSLMSAGDLASCRLLIKHIRQFGLNPTIVVGGNLVSTEPAFAMHGLPSGIIGIRYEGEFPLMELVRSLEQGRPWRQIEALCYQDETGVLVCNPPGLPVDILDDLPFAARDLAPLIAGNEMAVNIQTSRGCHGKCHYCCSPGFPKALSGSRRERSPLHLVEEIQSINERDGGRIFNFVDDDFIGPGKDGIRRALGFCCEIKKRDLSISFGIQARPNALTQDVIAELSDAGLSYVFFGFESDNRAVLTAWGRKERPFDLQNLVANLRAFQIEAQAGSIMFHRNSTFNGLRCQAQTLNNQGLLNYRTATNTLKILPGSALYHEYEQAGKIPLMHPGPLTPPCEDPAVEAFARALLEALDPLRPVWIYAASQFPVIVGKKRLAFGGYDHKYAVLKQAISGLEHLTADIFFNLLEAHEKGRPNEIDLAQQRSVCFNAAMQAAEKMASGCLVENVDLLREAIRMDCGL